MRELVAHHVSTLEWRDRVGDFGYRGVSVYRLWIWCRIAEKFSAEEVTIAGLERQLRVRLFQRTTRNLSPPRLLSRTTSGEAAVAATWDASATR